MNKTIIFGVILTLFLMGCSQTTVTKQPSELILEVADFPEGYSVKEKTPRLTSDLGKEALELGWESGYYVRYAFIGESIFDATVVEQHISVYPIENIQKVMDIPEESDETTTYEKLPAPDIGDSSVAYRITANDERIYQIEFIKKNVYESFYISGTATDFEFLVSLAKKAEAKIK